MQFLHKFHTYLFQRLAVDVPIGVMDRLKLSPKALRSSMQIRKLPGLVALPNISSDIVDHKLAENVLFKEDFSSPQRLFDAIEKRVIQPRILEPVTWEEEIQNFIIAGLICMTCSSFVFPQRGLEETTEALYMQTEEQARVFNQGSTQARLTVTGPPGTGLYICFFVIFFKLCLQGKRGLCCSL